MHICDLELSRAWAVSTLHEGDLPDAAAGRGCRRTRLARERVCCMDSLEETYSTAAIAQFPNFEKHRVRYLAHALCSSA